MASQTVQMCTEQQENSSASAAELIAAESESKVTEEALWQDKIQHQKPINTG